MVKVKLHGKMGRVFGKNHSYKLDRAGDIFAAISCNFPEFKNFLKNNKNIFFKILVDGLVIKNDISLLKTRVKEIDIIPMIVGSGGGASGFLSIAVGAALVIGGSIALASGAGFLVGVPLILGGLSLIAAGVSALMTPLTPLPPAPVFRSQEFQESKGAGRSFLFGATPQNITEGSSVPLVYGEVLIPGQMVASELITYDGFDNTNTVNSVPVIDGGEIRG
jgi:predicted phage tail protein